MKYSLALFFAFIFLCLSSFAFAALFVEGSFEYDTCADGTFLFSNCFENTAWVGSSSSCLASPSADNNKTNVWANDGNATDGVRYISHIKPYVGGGTCSGTHFDLVLVNDANTCVSSPQSEYLQVNLPMEELCVVFDGNSVDSHLFFRPSWDNCSGTHGFQNVLTDIDAGEVICFDQAYTNFSTQSSNGRTIYLDNFYIVDVFNLILTATETSDPVETTVDFNILGDVTDSITGLFVDDANCAINFNIEGAENMSIDTDINVYWYQDNILSSGIYYYDINCTHSDYTMSADANVTQSITVIKPPYQWLTFTALENISSYSMDINGLNIYPTNELNALEWCSDSNSALPETINYKIFNSLNDGRQYFIYTSPDGNAWVFDDTLTYGAANDDPVQKIWDANTDRFEYSFTDTLTANETKCYKADYKLTAGYWEVFTSDEWFMQLTPTNTEIDEKQTSIFYVSTYSDLRNYLYQYLPELTSTYNNSFEFQFTAWVDSGTLSLKLGTTVNGTDTTEAITLDVDKTRYSLEIDAGDYDSQLLMLTDTSTAKTIYLTDIALVQRGYFTQRLNILDKFGNELPPTLFNSVSQQSLTEGENYKFTTAAWDRDGDLNKLIFEAYLEVVADANKVRVYEFQFDSGAETEQDFDELVEGIIDLLGTASSPATPRQAKFKATLYDVNNDAVSTQSKWFRFIQYPTYPTDLSLNIIPINKKVATKPNGQAFISIKSPETLLGVKIYVGLSEKDIEDYNFNTYWKDQDFSCNGFNCNFDFEFDNWVYEDENKYSMILSALLTTQYEDTSDIRTSKRVNYWVYYKEFETARILETVERSDHNYTQIEEIQIVVQLRDREYSNMKDDFLIKVEPYECDHITDGNCVDFGTDYFPDSFLYDAETGYNYYFYKQLFLKDTYLPADDGNYIRFRGSINDSKNQFSSAANEPLLAPKCIVYDTDCSDGFCFFSNVLAGISHFLFGCTTPSSSIVTIAENSDEEQRIGVDADLNTTPPTQECLVCVKPDTNNAYENNLKQDLLCVSWYKLNQAPVDKFDFYVANEYSDFSKEGDFQQYIKFTVPHALVMYNDPILLREALKVEYGTEATNIGELTLQFLNYLFVGAVNYFKNVEITEDAWETGFVPNFGFDCNFERPIDPTYLNGLIGYRIRGLDVINKYDYTQADPEQYENIDPADLIEYLYYIDEPPEIGTTNIEVYGSSLTKIMEKELPSPLVIDVEYSESQFNKQNIDSNNASKFDVLPSTLRFQLIHDLFYNGQRDVIRRYVSVVITTTINPKQIDLVTFFTKQIEEFVENPFAYLVKFWFILFIIIVLVIILSVIYYNFKGGTAINIIRGG